MPELELEGYTLGQKQRYYNILVQNAIKNKKTVNAKDFNIEDSDIINLMNIDIASNTKNVEYILKVLTCNDMLYVSRAIKQSDWLINDQNYAHIVNPKYFHGNLFPQMCTKGIIKLMKHIRSTLNDNKRAEQFYCSENNPEEAVKWLPCCSLEFILENMTNSVKHIKTSLLRRLCEKSIRVLEIYMKYEETYKKSKAFEAAMFLLPSNVDKFLDLVEANEFPKFNKKATTEIMKKSADRVIQKFEKYFDFIHLPTFINCLKHQNIKDFLLKQAQNMTENTLYRYFNLKRLLLFIQFMPQEIRFEFVKEVFINKTHESKEICVWSEEEKNARSKLCNNTLNRTYDHIWYQFAPFNVALQKVQELIGSQSSIKDKVSLLEIALISAQNNLSHERTFLEFLRDNQNYTDNMVKEKILKELILKNNFVYYDIDTWNILDDIFKRIDIYNISKDSEPAIVEAIILYNVLHNEKVPEIIETKFQFNSLISRHKKISESEKELVFVYLHDVVVAKLSKCKSTNEEEFKEYVDTLELALNLLKDYKKELENYPNIIYTIKDLVKVKNDNSWTVSMEALFNIKKAWRKLLFKESLALCQNESVLLNALKHGPSLLEENEGVVKNILCNDKIPCRHVLGKIKIYWTSNLARSITIMYMDKLNGLGDHKATTRGLSTLLPSRHLQEVIEKYTPTEAKVDWVKINEIELSLQQQFAKHIHISRPQPVPEIVLNYAKGDYLQYALPSVLSVFYNLNGVASQKYIPKLLDAPVSLQKHGIRLAVSKFKYELLLSNFSNIWKNNKNASIRSVMFKTVFELLCKEKDSNKIKTTWELMEVFIDNITFQEDKAIYKLLFKVEKVPLEIRGLFYTKSYNFMHQLLKSGDEYKDFEYEFYKSFTEYSREIIEQLQPIFIVGIISEFIATEFTKQQTQLWARGCVIRIISSYLLCTPDEKTQLERYEKVLLPLLKESFTLWNIQDFIKINLSQLLNTLRCDIKQYIEMKKANPHKMFLLIYEELKSALEPSTNYILLTKWKLTVTFASILNEHNPLLQGEETCIMIANEFGQKCFDYLKEDCNKYFPRIYLLFVKALKTILDDLIPEIAQWDVYKKLIQDKTFIPGYLAAIVIISDGYYYEKETNPIFQQLCKSICEHPSTEIKIHYYNQLEEIQ